MLQETERRRERWTQFADPASPVNRMLVVSHTEGMPERPMLWWETMREREEWAYERYMRQMDDVPTIPDDSIPFLSMITGTEIFAEAFGCKVHKPLDNNPFALPLIRSWKEVRSIRVPRLENTRLCTLFDSADRLKARAGSHALLSLPDVQTPMDIAALIWEKSDFFAAMYEHPEAVRELAEKVKELLFAFFDEWFRRYGRPFISHFPDYYMPCGITMSEDEVGAVSGEMYRAFFEPELCEFSRRYGGIGVHCCANSAHQWENFRRIPGLKILNLCLPREQILASLPKFRDVCGQYPGCALDSLDGVDGAESLHLAQCCAVRTREEARRTALYYREHGVLPRA